MTNREPGGDSHAARTAMGMLPRLQTQKDAAKRDCMGTGAMAKNIPHPMPVATVSCSHRQKSGLNRAAGIKRLRKVFFDCSRLK